MIEVNYAITLNDEDFIVTKEELLTLRNRIDDILKDNLNESPYIISSSYKAEPFKWVIKDYTE